MLQAVASGVRGGAGVLLQPQRAYTLARGAGGRSSVSGVRATVFGATGFLGRYVVDLLGKSGAQVIVPYRGDELHFRHLRVMGDLGMIVPIPYNPHNSDSIMQAIERSDVVVNLVGRDHATSNFSLDHVHGVLAERIARLSASAGVKQLVHVSALGASTRSSSEFFRSKARGEARVRDAFPGAIVLRPAPVFGAEDRFIVREAKRAKTMRMIPLPHPSSRVQPVHWTTFAQAAAEAAIGTRAIRGATYEITGPNVYTQRRIREMINEVTGLSRPIVVVPEFVMSMIGAVTQRIPLFSNLYDSEEFKRQAVDLVASTESTEVLGVRHLVDELLPLEKEIVNQLRSFRPNDKVLGFEVTDKIPEVAPIVDVESIEVASAPFTRMHSMADERRKGQ